jgi:hypothetical protein
VQAALRVEHVGQAEQVVLVGPAAVVKDQQAGGLAGRWPLLVGERTHDRALARWVLDGLVRGRTSPRTVTQMLVLGAGRSLAETSYQPLTKACPHAGLGLPDAGLRS